MAARFDAFARALADDVSRRSAVQRLGAGLSALLFGAAACDADRGTAPIGTEPLLAAGGGGKGCRCRQNQVCFNNNCTCPPGTQHCIANDTCVAYCGAGQVLDATCACVSFCGAGTVLCGGTCVSNSCPAGQAFNPSTCQCEPTAGCPGGQTDCSGTCRDLQTDLSNCGQCGNVCGNLPNATAACVAGVCTIASCHNGFENCNGNAADGCETNTMTNVQHCGGCGQPCAPVTNGTAMCANGSCGFTCDQGFGNCDQIPGCETNLVSNPQHCGACGNDCGGYACVGSACLQTCGSDGDCVSTHFCDLDSFVCMPKATFGTPCTSDNQCVSGQCGNGVCQ